MKKQVYEIDELGYLKDIYVKEFDEQGNCTEELAENIVATDIPQGLYRSKWTGTEWVEDMPQAEIDAKNNVPRTLTEEQQRLLDLETAMTQVLGGTV